MMAMSTGRFCPPYFAKHLLISSSIKYFYPTIQGAGIFLPSNKAFKRVSPPVSQQGSNPSTPNATSLAAFNLGGRGDAKPSNINNTPLLPSKFSQSVGPGRSGAKSPELKSKGRPSLPRPESPLRRGQNPSGLTSSSRPSLGNPKLTKNALGGPRYAPSPTPGKFGASLAAPSKSINGDPGKKMPFTPKSNLKKPPNGTDTAQSNLRTESRSESRLGPEPMFDSESDNTPLAGSKSTYGAKIAQARSRPVSTQDQEIHQLKLQLADRDKQLERQAADLEEMQNSVNELQLHSPVHASGATARSSRGSGVDDLDAPSLRALVREKNEKIKQLTEEFDSHRADFRDTIDILERTSDETNRLHQEKIDNLQAETQELQERIDRGEDMDTLTQTLKQLDEQVQELEEGLEDARRGEAEARGEAEFLRGEVERTKAELDREKQKSAIGARNGNDGASNQGELMRELKRRDDEIKGLRAIIHSLNQSEAQEKGSPKAGRRTSKHQNSGSGQIHDKELGLQLNEERQTREKLQKEIKDLENLVDRKTFREEELEHEIQRLRKTAAHISSNSNGISEYTARPASNHRPNLSSNPSIDWVERSSPTMSRQTGSANAFPSGPTHRATASAGSIISRQQVQPTPESDSHSTTMTDGSNLWCDLCDQGGHDILSCTNVGGANNHKSPGRSGRHVSGGGGSSGGNAGLRPSAYTSPQVPPHDINEDRILDQGLGSEQASQHHNLAPLHYPLTSPLPSTLSAVAEVSSPKVPPPTSAPAPPPSTQAPPPPSSSLQQMPNPMDTGLVAGKISGIADSNKWCGMCERDGHDATDCPFEGQF